MNKIKRKNGQILDQIVTASSSKSKNNTMHKVYIDFLQPYLKYMYNAFEYTVDMYSLLELFFHVKDRDITQYKVINKFTLPNKIKNKHNKIVSGLTTINCDAKVGDRVFIRLDVTERDIIELELNETIYILNFVKYKSILKHLIEIR